MPRENPNGDRLQNPATKFYSWDSENACFKYYDKETKKNVLVEIGAKKPFVFLPLDVLSTVKGYCEADSSGYTANEVRDITKDVITVNTWSNGKSNLKASGLWSNIKDKVKAGGGKFSVSVYAAMKNGKEFEIVNIQMYGSALNAWIDFAKENNIYETAIAIRESEEKKKGKIVWTVPVLEELKVSKESDDKAAELQKELKVYHTAYFAKNASNAPQTSSEDYKPAKEAKSDAKASGRSAKKEEVEESVDDVDFGEDDDLPF